MSVNMRKNKLTSILLAKAILFGCGTEGFKTSANPDNYHQRRIAYLGCGLMPRDPSEDFGERLRNLLSKHIADDRLRDVIRQSLSISVQPIGTGDGIRSDIWIKQSCRKEDLSKNLEILMETLPKIQDDSHMLCDCLGLLIINPSNRIYVDAAKLSFFLGSAEEPLSKSALSLAFQKAGWCATRANASTARDEISKYLGRRLCEIGTHKKTLYTKSFPDAGLYIYSIQKAYERTHAAFKQEKIAMIWEPSDIEWANTIWGLFPEGFGKLEQV
jgi:hypothetical protein